VQLETVKTAIALYLDTVQTVFQEHKQIKKDISEEVLEPLREVQLKPLAPAVLSPIALAACYPIKISCQTSSSYLCENQGK
jgi:hypothetical protein